MNVEKTLLDMPDRKALHPLGVYPWPMWHFFSPSNNNYTFADYHYLCKIIKEFPEDGPMEELFRFIKKESHHFTVKMLSLYDPDTEKTYIPEIKFGFRNEDKIIYSIDDTQEITFDIKWPIKPFIEFLGRFEYSLHHMGIFSYSMLISRFEHYLNLIHALEKEIQSFPIYSRDLDKNPIIRHHYLEKIGEGLHVRVDEQIIANYQWNPNTTKYFHDYMYVRVAPLILNSKIVQKIRTIAGIPLDQVPLQVIL